MRSLFFVLVLFPFFSSSQNLIEEVFPTQNGKIIYQEVVKVDTTLTASNLYMNAREWMIDAFKSSNDVIQLDDKENCIIIGKGFVSKGHNSMIENPRNWFTLKIEARTGRYRYTLYDINYEFGVHLMNVYTHTNEPLEKWGDTSKISIDNPKKKEKTLTLLRVYYQQLDLEFRNIIASLKSRIISGKSDW